MLAEITELLCPPEEVESISDLSAQALYYFESLKHKFIVIGEKHGSEGSEYPLRELISKKSITKAIPMKTPQQHKNASFGDNHNKFKIIHQFHPLYNKEFEIITCIQQWAMGRK